MLYCYSISNPNSSLGCLDGLRFISMTWVVLGHASFAIISQMKNMGFAFKVNDTTWGGLPMDTKAIIR